MSKNDIIEDYKFAWVVIEVTYDYYRFEKVIGVAVRAKDAYNFAEKYNGRHEYDIYSYQYDDETCEKLDSDQMCHIQLLKIEIL